MSNALKLKSLQKEHKEPCKQYNISESNEIAKRNKKCASEKIIQPTSEIIKRNKDGVGINLVNLLVEAGFAASGKQEGITTSRSSLTSKEGEDGSWLCFCSEPGPGAETGLAVASNWPIGEMDFLIRVELRLDTVPTSEDGFSELPWSFSEGSEASWVARWLEQEIAVASNWLGEFFNFLSSDWEAVTLPTFRTALEAKVLRLVLGRNVVPRILSRPGPILGHVGADCGVNTGSIKPGVTPLGCSWVTSDGGVSISWLAPLGWEQLGLGSIGYGADTAPGVVPLCSLGEERMDTVEVWVPGLLESVVVVMVEIGFFRNRFWISPGPDEDPGLIPLDLGVFWDTETMLRSWWGAVEAAATFDATANLQELEDSAAPGAGTPPEIVSLESPRWEASFDMLVSLGEASFTIFEFDATANLQELDDS